MRQLLAQRQIGQRVERVVEIDQQLAPLHAGDVAGGTHFQARHRKLRRGAGVVPFDHDIARGGAMKLSRTSRDHIERHHARQHPPSRQSFAQHRDIADAVLQADDDGISRRMLRDDIGDLGGIGALDRDQHRAGIAEDRGSSDSVSAFAAICRSKPSKLVSRSPLLSISWITRGRASSATRRPAAASMPPTKQPMLPAPATPIGLSEIIAPFPQIVRDFDSRLAVQCLSKGGLGLPS